MLPIRPFIACCLLIPLLIGCTATRGVKLAGKSHENVQFAGFWEVNYRMSDRVQENAQLLRLIAMVEARRRAEGRLDRGWPVLPSFELIELADSISQATVLEIEQDPQQIEVKRGEEFPLTCNFGSNAPRAHVDQFGSEICGWDGHQLVFTFQLPGNLHVHQRLTLAPGGDKLNIATTVRTRGSGQAFTINRVYDRFEPLPDEYECHYIVGGVKSCRRATTERPTSS